MVKRLLLFALCFFTLTQIWGQGYKIGLKIKGLSDAHVMLGVHYNQTQFARDSTQLDKNGVGAFEGDKPLDGGMYFVFKDGALLFDFLVTDEDDQHFTIEADSKDYLGTLKITGSKQNEAFTGYLRELSKVQKQANVINEQLQKNPKDAKLLESKKENRNEMLAYNNKLVTEYPNTFLANVILASNPPEAPEINIPDTDPKRDSLMWAHYYFFNRNHFFDNVDFSDKRLLNTPFFAANMKTYFNKVLVFQQPDSIIPLLDRIIEKSKANTDVYHFCLSTLFNNYVDSEIMGQEAIVIHIAEKYYLSGGVDWVDKEFLDKVSDFVRLNKPTLIGKLAPDLKLQTMAGQAETLYGVKADYLVLIFYEPTCGHCKKEMPKIWEIYQKYRNKGVKVMAVYTQLKREEWEEYVAQGGYDWINVWDPLRTSNFRDLYNVMTTPQIYVLDKDKKVVGRRIDSKVLQQILTNYIDKKK